MQIQNASINTLSSNDITANENNQSQQLNGLVKSQEANNSNSNNKEQLDQINENQLIKSIESANKQIEIHNTHLKFSIHKKTKEIMVKVIDNKTDKVIREIPPEKILDMVAKMWEMAGILVDEKV